MMRYCDTSIAARKMDMTLHILEDQYIHSVTDIAARVNLLEEQVAFFLRFLATYSFIIYDEKSETALIRTEFLS
ncbi:MAG: hypothetical protein U9O85_03980, partial [Euryarchaeota archaeon]|nr:hypothetical protein [Euryarchaeota archaeon]